MTLAAPVIAGVELGGSTCVALIARGRRVLDQVRVPTTDPTATLSTLSNVIGRWAVLQPIAALGLASFGPLDLDPASPGYGRLTTTPKPGWAGAAVRDRLALRLPVPIGLDTDVAGAALAEGLWGAAAGARVHAYLTVGTGIGGAVVADGRVLRGLGHAEMGHARVRRAAGDGFAGVCPYHGDCLEGLASGTAIAARAGAPAETLAELAATLILTLAPEKILIGGGVALGQPHLLPMIRRRVSRKLAGYVDGLTGAALERRNQPPGLGALAGPLGAIALGRSALGLTAAGPSAQPQACD
jgi:fructokinase